MHPRPLPPRRSGGVALCAARALGDAVRRAADLGRRARRPHAADAAPEAGGPGPRAGTGRYDQPGRGCHRHDPPPRRRVQTRGSRAALPRRSERRFGGGDLHSARPVGAGKRRAAKAAWQSCLRKHRGTGAVRVRAVRGREPSYRRYPAAARPRLVWHERQRHSVCRRLRQRAVAFRRAVLRDPRPELGTERDPGRPALRQSVQPRPSLSSTRGPIPPVRR